MGILSDATSFLLTPLTGGALQAFDAVVDYITPDIPGSRDSGDPLQQGDIDANTARKGSVEPEWWGFRKRFPDLIVAKHTYYESKFVQITNHGLLVGKGEYSIAQSNVRIGDTPITSFGVNAAYDIYGPGVSVAADPRFDCWYNQPSVGTTSTGGSGLDLSAENDTTAVVADLADVIGYTITFDMDEPLDGPVIPPDWEIGTVCTVLVPKSITVLDSGSVSVFTGDFQDIEPFVGMPVSVVSGGQQYDWTVDTYTDNAGVDDELTFLDEDDNVVTSATFPDGTFDIAIGYRNNEYKITALGFDSITFDRLDEDGNVVAWGGWTARTGLTNFSVTAKNAGVNWIGPYDALPEGELTTEVELDFYFPNGLIKYKKSDGGKRTETLPVTVQYRDADAGGAWSEITYTYSDKEPDALGFTEKITFDPPIRPEFRVKRDEPEEDTSASTRLWKCHWQRLKAKLQVRPDSYADVTTMGVTIRTGDMISAQTKNQISVTAMRRIDGEDANTISGFITYMAEQSGMPLSQIDTDTLDELESTYWTPRGETFDYIFDTQGTAEEAAELALAAGMAQRIDVLGKISAAREGVKPASWGIAPVRMTSVPVLSYSTNRDDVYNGVDVKYVDPETWTDETVECRLDGVDATRVEEITVEGVTDKTRAWRIGMRRLRQNLALPYSFSASAEMEPRNFSPLDVVVTTNDIHTLSGEIYGFTDTGTAQVFAVQEFLAASDWTDPRVIIIDHSGVPTDGIAPESLTDYGFTLPADSIDWVPSLDGTIDRPTFILYDNDEPPFFVMISSISPSSLTETDFSGVEYDATFYADDDNEPE